MTMNAVNWFEIPAADLDRAQRFYERMLNQDLKRTLFDGSPMSIFPADERGVGGCLVADAQRKPSGEGTVIYLNVEGKLDACLERVPAAGGAVVVARTAIGPHGFIALVRDSEGNTIGLHSQAP